MSMVPTIALSGFCWNCRGGEGEAQCGLFLPALEKGYKKAPVQYRGRKYGANDRG